jgi:nucleotide-binding universal stress UspA family protein
MNNIILVPTDLSVSSKAGIRFALQLATQGKSSLQFYHCLSIVQPTRWRDAKYADYVAKQKENAQKVMTKLVNILLPGSRVKKSRIGFVVQHAEDVNQAILSYAETAKVSAVCMSTRGAGRFKKLIGTHASGIISHSPVPVFVIPATYRRNTVSRILYASDLNNIGSELQKVRTVAEQLKAAIVVYHYDYLANVEEARKKFEKAASRHKQAGVTFTFKKFNVDKSLANHLLRDMRTSKASLVVLFTDQKRGWFDKLFLSSKSADVSFQTKIPLLIFPK